MENGTLEIVENSLNNLPMSCDPRMHELADLVDGKTDVKSGDGIIL